MTLFVYIYVLSWVILGSVSLFNSFFNYIKNHKIKSVFYSDASENDTEYLLRHALGTYPCAVIYASLSPISETLSFDNQRIICIRQ